MYLPIISILYHFKVSKYSPVGCWLGLIKGIESLRPRSSELAVNFLNRYIEQATLSCLSLSII